MRERDWAALPVEELVHPEEGDVVERDPLLVDPRSEQRILARRPDGHDQRDRATVVARRGEIVEQLAREDTMKLLARRREGERHTRALRQLVRRDRQPVAQAVRIDRHAAPA